MECEWKEIALWALAAPTLIWICSYFGPLLLCMLPAQNLKKKYGAEWALVTGGGSGIGRALVEALALQGFNVVVVSLDDKLLQETMTALTNHFPSQKFIKVGVNFAPGVDYMAAIKKATSGIKVQCVFNNAGYIVTGFYDHTDANKQAGNMECNAVAAARITHHFVGEMIAAKLKGCIVFTSSVAAYMPTPFSIMYGATKAFVSNLAASLAVEVQAKGIDVLSIHPSPVASNFYSNLDHKIDMMDQAAKGAVQPSTLPQVIFKAGTFMLPYNFLATAFAIAAPYLPDYKKNDVDR